MAQSNNNYNQGMYNLSPNPYITSLDMMGISPNDYTSRYMKYMGSPPFMGTPGTSPAAGNTGGLANLPGLATPTQQSSGTYRALGNTNPNTIIPPASGSQNSPAQITTPWNMFGNMPLNPEQVSQGYAPVFTMPGGNMNQPGGSQTVNYNANPISQSSPMGQLQAKSYNFQPSAPDGWWRQYGISDQVAQSMNLQAPSADTLKQFQEAAPQTGGVSMDTTGWSPSAFTYNSRGQATGFAPGVQRNLNLMMAGQVQGSTADVAPTGPIGVEGTTIGMKRTPGGQVIQNLTMNPNIIQSQVAKGMTTLPMESDNNPPSNINPMTGMPTGTFKPVQGGYTIPLIQGPGSNQEELLNLANQKIANEVSNAPQPPQMYSDSQIQDIRNNLQNFSNDPYKTQQYLRTLGGGMPQDIAQRVLEANGGTPGTVNSGMTFGNVGTGHFGENYRVDIPTQTITQYNPNTGRYEQFNGIPDTSQAKMADIGGGNFLDQYGNNIAGAITGAGLAAATGGMAGLGGLGMGLMTGAGAVQGALQGPPSGTQVGLDILGAGVAGGGFLPLTPFQKSIAITAPQTLAPFLEKLQR